MDRKTIVCLLILFSILVTGCTAKEPATKEYNPLRPLYDYQMDDSNCNHVYVLHDDAKNVTVYVFDGYKSGGLTTIPDWQLTPTDK